MSYGYGVPGGAEIGRPRCWGNPAEFNPDLRECRGCTFQNSCRDNVVKIRNYAAAPYATHMPVTGYAPAGYVPAPSGFQPTPSYPSPVAPTPLRVGPVPVPVSVSPAPPQPLQVAPSTSPQRQGALYPPPQQYEYGWLHDPMYQAMAACPPPIRPQLPGESFWERVMKNMFLAAGESFFMHGFLAMRQLVLPPEHPQNMTEVSSPTPPGTT